MPNTLDIELQGKITIEYEGEVPHGLQDKIKAKRDQQNKELEEFIDTLVKKNNKAADNDQAYERAMRSL